MIFPGLPKDEAVLAAIGTIALRHGQLDYSFKMAVRSLANLTIEEAVEATDRQGSSELRDRVRRLAKKRIGESEALARLDVIITRARRATDRRNEVLHSLWAHELDGESVIRVGSSEFIPIPSVSDLEALADEMAQTALDLHRARLDGFLKQALAPSN